MQKDFFELKLYTVNEEYMDYLREYDYRVPDTTHNKNRRPFIGIILKVDDVNYFVPLSSPKAKHSIMHNNIDFEKINGGEFGAINFNNMIPIPLNKVNLINFAEIKLNNKNDVKYKNLIAKQIKWCQEHRNKLQRKAKKLHSIVIGELENNCYDKFKDRCCDFLLLEQKCKKYENEITLYPKKKGKSR